MRLKDALYYGIAGLLFLATVPMYHYIFTHYKDRDSEPKLQSVTPYSHRWSVPSPSPRQQLFYAWNEKLPEGYKCSAANGLVYRTRLEGGATVIEPLRRDGFLVRCGGDENSSYRRY